MVEVKSRGPCPHVHRCAFVDESCTEEKTATCDVITKTTPPPPKEWNPQEPAAVTMTMEQWQTIAAWVRCCADWNHARMVWWRDCCADKKMGAEIAAQHMVSVQKMEDAAKIIEEVIYGR